MNGRNLRNIMNKFLILGDSYFDYKIYRNVLHCPTNLWMNQLNEKYQNQYKFYNYAKSGTGPQYALKILNSWLEKSMISKNDILMIHLSNPDRIDFMCEPELTGHMNQLSFDFDKMKSYCTVGNTPEDLMLKDSRLKRVKLFYEEFQNEIDFSFCIFKNEILYMNLNYISFLYTISKLYNVKVILFATISPALPIGLENFINLNYENFFISKYNLFDLSFDEIFDEEKSSVAGRLKFDKRFNHFSCENHEIMLEYIEKVIKNDYENLPKFKKNFKSVNEIFSRVTEHRRITHENEMNHTKNQFIYE